MPELEGTMTLDQTAPDEPASETVEQPVAIPAPGHEYEPEGDGDDEPELTVEELDEIEFAGKKHRIPKELKPAFLMQADYTQKTQAVAEMRKALEAQAAQHATVSRERVQALGKIMHADEVIAQLQQTDWDAEYQKDPLGAPQKYMQLQQWKDHRAEIAHQVAQADAHRTHEAQQQSAKRLEEAQAVLARDIPNWDAEKSKVAEHAISLGFTPEQLNGIDDPRIVKVLHQAMIGARLMKTAAAPQSKPKTVVPDAPLAQVSARTSNSGARKSLSDMSMEEYYAARKGGRAG